MRKVFNFVGALLGTLALFPIVLFLRVFNKTVVQYTLLFLFIVSNVFVGYFVLRQSALVKYLISEQVFKLIYIATFVLFFFIQMASLVFKNSKIEYEHDDWQHWALTEKIADLYLACLSQLRGNKHKEQEFDYKRYLVNLINQFHAKIQVLKQTNTQWQNSIQNELSQHWCLLNLAQLNEKELEVLLDRKRAFYKRANELVQAQKASSAK